MNTTKANLAPTLWRTCRALANRHRLRMLWAVMETPGLTVSQISRRLGLPMTVASEYLRSLNARGVLRASRNRRSVSYRATADPSVPQASVLLKALAATLETDPQPTESAFADLTAFTHWRRAEIVRLLQRRPMGSTALARELRACVRSVRRHLAKLRRRGYVALQGGAWQLSPPERPLAAALLQLAMRSS